jgi:hypothetical protein
VAPLAPRPGHRLLRCPICRLDLAAKAGALACRNRHSFDLAREGYVNLLSGKRRRPAQGGDRPEQLTHRAVFLDAGHFDFIAAAIGSRLQQTGALPSDRAWRVLEAGCGISGPAKPSLSCRDWPRTSAQRAPPLSARSPSDGF